jgi:hypothetical protein
MFRGGARAAEMVQIREAHGYRPVADTLASRRSTCGSAPETT